MTCMGTEKSRQKTHKVFVCVCVIKLNVVGFLAGIRREEAEVGGFSGKNGSAESPEKW